MENKSKHDKEISIGDIKKQMRLLNSGVYINHLKKWANEDQDVNDKMIKEALQILEDVILGEYKDDFLVKVSAGEIFYRARTISIDDYGNVEKGLHISKDRLFGYNWKESKEPPEKYAAAGRNSQKKESALYLASNEITACVEARPPIRALVSIAEFVLNKDITIIDFSKLSYKNALDIKDEKYNIDIRKFLSNILALFSSPVYSKKEYKITQKLVKYFRDRGFQGFKYRSFYADGYNFTFFDESMGLFTWKNSRVVLNYAVANLFISLDRTNESMDIENINKVQDNVNQKVRDQIWHDISQLWRLEFPIDEGFIAYDIILALQEGRNITQRELTQKRNTTLYKVRKVQRKLKAAGMIVYSGSGRYGKWKLVDSVNE